MVSKEEFRDLIDDVFEEEALVFGGLVAIHDVDDEMVWRLMRNLDVIRRRTLGKLDDKEPNLKPHPAIEEFLAKMRAPVSSAWRDAA
jgi:hypothetical protein